MQNKYDDVSDLGVRSSARGGQDSSSSNDSGSAFHESVVRSGKSSNAFKTISEVADELGVQQHVLRFWETKFSQVRPLKRGGGRRYYRPEDVQLLHAIHNLLYTEGYTIKGVQKLLRDMGKKKILEGVEIVPASRDSSVDEPAKAPEKLTQPQTAAQASALITTAQSMHAASSAVLPESAHPIKAKAGLTDSQRETLDGLLSELKEIRNIIKS